MLRRHTILVVDDEPDVVQSVKDLLRLDYNVLGTTKAEEAVRMMQEQEVDVVMTDQRMPEMTGVQLLEQIKGPYPEATRLLFTGYADIRAVIEAINQGNVYRYITKPWDPDELQTIIREACERHDLIVQRRILMDELEKANGDLREANDVKAAFIQVASHELRTPLSILLGYSELAKKMSGPASPTNEWLARIHNAAERLKSLIDQIITMLQAGDFHANLERKPVELSSFITSAVEDVAPFVELRQQRLVRDWTADMGTMNIDAPKMRDAINHLLLNAIKFTADGGQITVFARRTDGNVQIGIIDTGCGIEEAELKRYGEAFFTGYDVTRHSSGTYEHGRRGLGLGASVVKKFVEMHGGKVSVVSKVGQGTTATITLPDSQVATPSPGTPGEGGGEGNSRV
jgi:signal transduction histidine kinase